MQYERLDLAIDKEALDALNEGVGYKACLPSARDAEDGSLRGKFMWHPATGTLVEFEADRWSGVGGILVYAGPCPEEAAALGPGWPQAVKDGDFTAVEEVDQEELKALLEGRAESWRRLNADGQDPSPAMAAAMEHGTLGGWIRVTPRDEDSRGNRFHGDLSGALAAADAMTRIEAAAKRAGAENWVLRDCIDEPWAHRNDLSFKTFLPHGTLNSELRDEVNQAMKALDEAGWMVRPHHMRVALASTSQAEPGGPWFAESLCAGVGDGAYGFSGSWVAPTAASARQVAYSAASGHIYSVRAHELITRAWDKAGRPRMPSGKPGGPFERALEEGITAYCASLGLLIDFDNPQGRPVLEGDAYDDEATSVSVRLVRPSEVLDAWDRNAARGRWKPRWLVDDYYTGFDDAHYPRTDLTVGDLSGKGAGMCAAIAALMDDGSLKWALGDEQVVSACREAVEEAGKGEASDSADAFTFVFDVRAEQVDPAWRGDVPAGLPVTCVVSLRRRESPEGSNVKIDGWESTVATYVGDCRVRFMPGEFASYGMFEGGRAARPEAVAARRATWSGPLPLDMPLSAAESIRHSELRGAPDLRECQELCDLGAAAPVYFGAESVVAWAWGAQRLGHEAVVELPVGRLLSRELALGVEDRPEELRGPCVATDGLGWFACTGGELPALGSFATREAACAFALAGRDSCVGELAELRSSLAEWDRAWAPRPGGGLDEPAEPSPSPALSDGAAEREGARL